MKSINQDGTESSNGAPSSQARSAPIWRRLLALLYDSLILAAISLGYGGLHLLYQVQVLGAQFEEGEQASMGFGGFIGWCLVLMAFYTFFWRRGGQTLGMRAWRLKLVADTSANDSTHHPPSLTHCLTRCITAPPLLLLGGLGLWWCWIDANHRSAYDRLSGTTVLLLPKNKRMPPKK